MAGDFVIEFEQARQEFAARVQVMVDGLSSGLSAAERERALLADLEDAQERVEFLEQLLAICGRTLLADLAEAQERVEFLEQLLGELRALAVQRRDWTMVSVIDASLRKE